MPKPLPVPPTQPSARGRRVLAAIQALAQQPDQGQAVVDLLHVESTFRDELDPAIFRAIDPEYGGTPYRKLAAMTGLALGAVQKRFDAGELEVRGFRAPRKNYRKATPAEGNDDAAEPNTADQAETASDST